VVCKTDCDSFFDHSEFVHLLLPTHRLANSRINTAACRGVPVRTSGCLLGRIYPLAVRAIRLWSERRLLGRSCQVTKGQFTQPVAWCRTVVCTRGPGVLCGRGARGLMVLIG
jgi:hypothetical protein